MFVYFFNLDSKSFSLDLKSLGRHRIGGHEEDTLHIHLEDHIDQSLFLYCTLTDKLNPKI